MATKKYTQMTAAELAEATKEFDQEIDLERDTRPLTEEERERFERARRAPHLSLMSDSKGGRRVLVTLEPKLLEQADAYARRHDKSRSELIAEGLRLAMQKK